MRGTRFLVDAQRAERALIRWTDVSPTVSAGEHRSPLQSYRPEDRQPQRKRGREHKKFRQRRDLGAVSSIFLSFSFCSMSHLRPSPPQRALTARV